MVMHWQYVSICRGGKSILEKISGAGINPEDYISFFSLRGYAKIHHVHNENKHDKIRKQSKKGKSTVDNVRNDGSHKISKEPKNGSITEVSDGGSALLPENS